MEKVVTENEVQSGSLFGVKHAILSYWKKQLIMIEKDSASPR